jgi:hypothetical protein
MFAAKCAEAGKSLRVMTESLEMTRLGGLPLGRLDRYRVPEYRYPRGVE